MDESRSSETENNNKMDEVMLPGFRFHPTDEELVGFYLKKKIQHRPLSIELIKQLDIYKYDPWDLPKLATIGEKEWYFYCPRDRKYRNSARPNRVTGAGFWKATGTDRPIYNSEGSKCIGLKKSLVFYKGRAAKGIKTDWMMHEFRLPSTTTTDSSKRYIDRNIPANDAWAICRIFKKTNSTTQRALSHSWVPPSSVVNETTTSDLLSHQNHNVQSNTSHQLLSLDNFSSLLPTKTSSNFHQFCGTMMMNNHFERSPPSSLASSFSSPLLDFLPSSYTKSSMNHQKGGSASDDDELTTTNYTFSSSTETPSQPSSSKCTTTTTINDASSILLNMSSSIFGDLGNNLNKASSSFEGSLMQGQNSNNDHAGGGGVLGTTPLEKGANYNNINNNVLSLEEHHHQLGSLRSSIGFPYGFPALSFPDNYNVWGKSNLVVWDSSSSSSLSPSCPSSEISATTTNYSTNKCYT